MGSLQIDVLGTSFAIQAKEDTSYLELLLDYYKQITRQVEGIAASRDTLKTAVLAGIMLCDELYKEKTKNIKNIQQNIHPLNLEELAEAEKLTLRMIENIDKALQ